jgi:hypothetical protein
LDVDQNTATFVAEMFLKPDYPVVRVQTGEEEKWVEFILDKDKLAVQLEEWDCSFDEFCAANREKKGAATAMPPITSRSKRKSSKQVSQRKSRKRVITVCMTDDGGVYIRNWAIPIAKMEGEDRESRKKRIRTMQEGRNRYEILEHLPVNYGMLLPCFTHLQG